MWIVSFDMWSESLDIEPNFIEIYIKQITVWMSKLHCHYPLHPILFIQDYDMLFHYSSGNSIP